MSTNHTSPSGVNTDHSTSILTPQEVRGLLRISRTTLWRWVAERGLPSIRVGGLLRFRRADVEAFLKRHEVKAGD